uniref:Planctomycete cytochrome C domain secreted protein n=1 Tax=uncultured bacterium Lac161 TaxID=1403002 RepID=A0A059Q9R5_9BACT|nr:planctomycete cytochrome C domain secreted protein [uncultured bacterium Lac161]
MSKQTTSWVCALLLVAAPSGFAANKSAPGKPRIDFNRDIRTILSDNCFACHGPDENKRKAKLRFDVKDEAFKPAKSGDHAIVPGDLKNSQLVARITTKDEDDLMPPPKSGKKLTPQQIDLLKRWIAEGAPWQTHWAYEAPKRPALPQLKDKKWPKNEIDHFVLAKLEKEKLKPSPEADKTTLVRRASFDLTGLPPTPEEIDAFLADKSPQAYEKVVDRLLASPRYGEHEARYWLDAARYADSHGYHIDSERSMWKWRDWVINAFNKNMPYDQFSIEQLAGDLLPEATVDQKIGSGYVRANMSTGEGGAIESEYQAKYTFDRVETTATIWMGLTMTCARCHTHKYDPIQHKEYYGLYAIFNNLNEAVMDGNKPNPDPFIKVPTPEQTSRQKELKGFLAGGQKKLDAPMPELDKAQPDWEAKWREKLSEGWTTLKPESVASTNGTEFEILDNSAVLAGGTNPPKDVYEVKLPVSAGSLAAIKLEALPHASLPQKASGRADDGNFRLSEFEAEIVYETNVPPASRRDEVSENPSSEKKKDDVEKSDTKTRQDAGGTLKPTKIKFTQALADSSRAGNEAALAIDGKSETGWQADTNGLADPHAALFLPADPIAVKTNATLVARLKFEASTSKRAIGHFRLAAAQNEQLVQLLAPPKTDPWQVVGPFKTENTHQGFTNVFEPEKEVDLKKSYTGVRDEIKWNAKPDFDDGKANLLVQDLHGVHGAYYLYRTMKLSAARKVEFAVRADDLFKLWVNGKPVAERSVKEKTGEGPVKVAVDLKKGENKLLLKVITTQGAAYFTFRKDIEESDAIPADVAAMFAATSKFTSDQQKKIRTVYRRLHSPEFKETYESVEKWKEENDAVEKAIPTTMVAKEMEKPRDTFMLVRGEYDKKGDKVGPGVPAVLPPWPSDQPTNRLGFARWLLQPDHPLTARVTVNRYWQQYFGTGLVKTTEDFGVQGDNPSHPELLDWLATEFVRMGWDVKRMQKLIVMSATYRQSSKLTPQLLGRDPENRLLARGPRFRVDAEAVRDTALFISGLLVEHIGGKGVKPYQPSGLWEAVSFNNSQKYVPDTGEGQHRRSLYTYWKRQSPPPSMMIFDAPTREYCVVKRPRTNTPLQALALMNDPQIVDASRAFAQRTLTEGGKDAEARVAFAFRLATGRKISKDEARVLLDLYKQQLGEYQQNKESADKLLSSGSVKPKSELDRAELAAWTMVANTILNLDETITKN